MNYQFHHSFPSYNQNLCHSPLSLSYLLTPPVVYDLSHLYAKRAQFDFARIGASEFKSGPRVRPQLSHLVDIGRVNFLFNISIFNQVDFKMPDQKIIGHKFDCLDVAIASTYFVC
jgi:hypothetical protein